jgi:outer membrane protein assembly factor BamB
MKASEHRDLKMRYKFTYNLCKVICLLIIIQSLSSSASTSNQIGQERDTWISLSQPLTVKWLYQSDITTNLTPTADGIHIYLPLASGLLISLNAYDGQLIWKTDIGGELSSSPAADERGVYVASETGGGLRLPSRANGALRALGREGGITLWMRTLPMPIQGTLITNENILYGGSSDGKVYAVKKHTGEIVWIMQHSAPFASQPVIFGSRLYIGSDDGSLFSLDQFTGKISWRYRTRGAIHGKAVVADGIVYFGSTDGYVYALRETNGSLRWRRRTGAGVQTVAYAQSGLLAVSLDNFVYCLSYRNGDRLWKHQLAGRIAAEPLTTPDGALFTPLSSSIGVVLDLREGKQINSLPIGEDNSITAAPVVAGQMLLITTRHGLAAFSRPN